MYQFNKKNFILPIHYEIKQEKDAIAYIENFKSGNLKLDHSIDVNQNYGNYRMQSFILFNCFSKTGEEGDTRYYSDYIKAEKCGTTTEWQMIRRLYQKSLYCSINKNGKLHGFNDNPAVVNFGANPKNFNSLFVNDGNLGRQNGDGLTFESYKNNEMWERQYTKNNKLHRVDGAAIEKRFARSYFEDGKLHNLKGPAEINNGKFEFWVNNKRIQRKEKSIAFILYVEKKYEELENYLSLVALKHGMQ